MADQTQQHVRIEQRDGVTVYSAGFWSGWYEVIMLSIVFLVISGMLGFLLWAMHGFKIALDDIIEIGWLHTILSFIIGGAFDIGLIVSLGFIALWIPYFLIYRLSPKRFWINDDTLFHTAYLLGFIPHHRKIPFEQILNVDHGSSNGRYAVEVLYEPRIPKVIFIILVYWNEKLTQWPMCLVNGIGTMQEAEKIQNALLEPMTDSEVCRVGG